jgi:hypothetical protein
MNGLSIRDQTDKLLQKRDGDKASVLLTFQRRMSFLSARYCLTYRQTGQNEANVNSPEDPILWRSSLLSRTSRIQGRPVDFIPAYCRSGHTVSKSYPCCYRGLRHQPTGLRRHHLGFVHTSELTLFLSTCEILTRTRLQNSGTPQSKGNVSTQSHSISLLPAQVSGWT